MVPESLPQPILFRLLGFWRSQGGTPLLRRSRTFPALSIAGVTRAATGVPLGGCTVKLYRTATDELVETGVSDGSGVYSFATVGPGQNYYVVAYLPGSPDVAGTTVNTLAGSP